MQLPDSAYLLSANCQHSAITDTALLQGLHVLQLLEGDSTLRKVTSKQEPVVQVIRTASILITGKVSFHSNHSQHDLVI